MDLSNDYPDHHKFEVTLFKSDRTAIESLSYSLKQQHVLSEVPTTLLLAGTKHRQNIIIQNQPSVIHLKPTAKDRQRQFILKYSLWQVVFHNGHNHNCDRTLTFLVKEFLSEVVILVATKRQLGRAEGKGITAYTIQLHCSRLKVNRNFQLPQFSCQRWPFPSSGILTPTSESVASTCTNLICFTAMIVDDKHCF